MCYDKRMSQEQPPPPKEPELPEGKSANEVLNEMSDKDRTALAQAQGMSLVAYDRYLNVRARRERVDEAVAGVYTRKAEKATVSTERNPHDIKAEEAVLKGLKEALDDLEPTRLSEDEAANLEKQAYELVEQSSSASTNQKVTLMRKKATEHFEQVALSQALDAVDVHIADGMTRSEALKELSMSLEQRAKRQNMREMAEALETVSRLLSRGGYRKDKIVEPPTWLRKLISEYGTRALETSEQDLLRDLVKYGKQKYFKGEEDQALSEEIIRKSGLDTYARNLLPHIANAYRKYGPHQRTAHKTTGNTEVYEAVQSDEVAGYRRDSKARPHRDPSGGNGEKF
jgi:hypothetical protein